MSNIFSTEEEVNETVIFKFTSGEDVVVPAPLTIEKIREVAKDKGYKKYTLIQDATELDINVNIGELCGEILMQEYNESKCEKKNIQYIWTC